MADLPKKHAKPCPKCGGVLWLKDYDPSNLWYGCENYKSQGCKGSISANEIGSGNGQRRPQAQSQPTGNETNRVSKIECPECHCQIIVDVHASSLGTVKKKEQANTVEGVATNDDIPF